MHQTKDLEDGYMGSGKLIKRAINKHGVENFTKEILHVLDTEDEMRLKESEIVNEEYVSRDDTYNLCHGGKGGFGYINEELSEKMFKIRQENALKIPKNIKVSNGLYYGNMNFKQAYLKGNSKHNSFLGKRHTEKTKRMMSNSHKGIHKGQKNSQYGTCWITDGLNNKKIKKEFLETWLNDGWKRGRVV